MQPVKIRAIKEILLKHGWEQIKPGLFLRKIDSIHLFRDYRRKEPESRAYIPIDYQYLKPYEQLRRIEKELLQKRWIDTIWNLSLTYDFSYQDCLWLQSYKRKGTEGGSKDTGRKSHPETR